MAKIEDEIKSVLRRYSIRKHYKASTADDTVQYVIFNGAEMTDCIGSHRYVNERREELIAGGILRLFGGAWTAQDIKTMIRAWLDADDATHWGAFEKRLDEIIGEDDGK